MSTSRKIALVTLIVVFMASLMLSSVLVACQDDNNKDDGYTIYVKSLGGLGLADVTVTVTDNGKKIAEGATDKDGKFSFAADKGVYDVAVTNLPLGYTLTGSNYKTSKDDKTLTITASSSVITSESIPSGKVYKVGDVAYDFTILDLTDRTNTKEYTLSEVLAEKKMVLLNFWNTGCGPCVSEMPALELAYRDYQDEAEVFAINVSGITGDDKWADVRSFKNDGVYTDAEGNTFSLTFPMSLDDQDGNQMRYHYTINSIPTSVVIDRYGVIALIHTGSMNQGQFTGIFEKYTSDNYVQDQVGNGGGDGEEIVRVKPNVSMPDSSEIEAAINGANFNGTYHPELNAEDAEYSWPWLVGETNGEKYIYPANSGVDYSFATIYTSVTITQSDITNNGNVVLAFDLQWSCENWCDYLYVLINGTYVYSYTGTDQWGNWQTCYALVANEPGTYELILMYYKDPELSEGFDTVRVKNVHMMSISTLNSSAPSLDMPRDAANWTTSSQYDYVTVVKDADGFYHKDSADGPYILADLMNTTNFNKRLETTWSVSEFAGADYFNYNKVDEDDPSYSKALDDTDAISLWAMAANNSELYGLTVVNDELIELLNKFIKTQIGESDFNENIWLEFCLYFDHYGYDTSDKGICDMTRNPIRGLLNITAMPITQVYDGELDLNNIPDEYKNEVYYDRIIVPRGLKYLIVPEVSGVYRFRTQSIPGLDTMGWLYNFNGRELVSTDEQLENPDREYNMVLTYYLKAGEQYIFASTFTDPGVFDAGYTFTVEYLGAEAYVWQYTGRGYLSFIDDDFGGITNFQNVQYAIGEDGYVYVALRDANGRYITDSNGNYLPDYNDPLYVDFVTGARFFADGSLELALHYGETSTIRKTLSRIFAEMWGKTAPEDGWSVNTTLEEIKGAPLTSEDWEDLIVNLYYTYGDSVYIDDQYMIDALVSCTTIGGSRGIITYLQDYYLGFFNQSNIRYDSSYGIDESLYKDYTDLVEMYYNLAIANEGNPDRGYQDKGSVQLTVELMQALNMFCKRIGGYPELDTEWLSLCAHYQHMGANN